MVITLNGIPPSKKNSKRILVNNRTGKRFISASKRHKDWHSNTMCQMILDKVEAKKITRCQVRIMFHISDKVRRDLTNMADSVMDLLVDYGVIEDDNYFNVVSLHLYHVPNELDQVVIHIEEFK